MRGVPQEDVDRAIAVIGIALNVLSGDERKEHSWERTPRETLELMHRAVARRRIESIESTVRWLIREREVRKSKSDPDELREKLRKRWMDELGCSLTREEIGELVKHANEVDAWIGTALEAGRPSKRRLSALGVAARIVITAGAGRRPLPPNSNKWKVAVETLQEATHQARKRRKIDASPNGASTERNSRMTE
jgi:hypothetical protein